MIVGAALHHRWVGCTRCVDKPLAVVSVQPDGENAPVISLCPRCARQTAMDIMRAADEAERLDAGERGE